jgi:hypothetical protein
MTEYATRSPVASAETDHAHHDHLCKEARPMALHRNLQFADLDQQAFGYLLRQASVGNRSEERSSS